MVWFPRISYHIHFINYSSFLSVSIKILMRRVCIHSHAPTDVKTGINRFFLSVQKNNQPYFIKYNLRDLKILLMIIIFSSSQPSLPLPPPKPIYPWFIFGMDKDMDSQKTGDLFRLTHELISYLPGKLFGNNTLFRDHLLCARPCSRHSVEGYTFG